MKEHIVKPCPRCGQPLEIKTNRETGSEFLGCSAFVSKRAGMVGTRVVGCGYTEPLPEAIKLRRQGQKGMFD